MKKKTQVVLCGTGYGQTYLPAIYQSDQFELAAILARGSEQSVRLSEQAGVNLYTDVNDIQESIDLACVAVGDEAGKDIAKSLLEKKVSVLTEHPINQEDFEELQQVASRENIPLHVNAHFSDLEPAKQFIGICRSINQNHQPLMIQLHANSRTLYSMLDLLMRCFGLFDVDELVNRVVGNNYVSSTFSLNGIPCHLSYQRWKGKTDNSTDMPLGHQLTFVYPIGTLTLNGTYGPCIWSPLIAAGLPKLNSVHLQPSSIVRVTPQKIIDWRIQSNHEALVSLVNSNNESTQIIRHQTTKYLMHLTGTWTRFYNLLGVPQEAEVVQNLDPVYWSIPNQLSE